MQLFTERRTSKKILMLNPVRTRSGFFSEKASNSLGYILIMAARDWRRPSLIILENFSEKDCDHPSEIYSHYHQFFNCTHFEEAEWEFFIF